MKIFNMVKNQYLQSFQKQIVIFSSVIILSEKKNTQYSCAFFFPNIFLSIICDLVHNEVHSEGNVFTL